MSILCFVMKNENRADPLLLMQIRSGCPRPVLRVASVYALFMCCGISWAGGYVDWSAISVRDTLVLYLKGRRAGRLVHTIVPDSASRRIRVDNLINMSSGEPDVMSLSESREYDWRGRLIGARQSLHSPSGISAWTLSGRGRGWDLAVSAGGIEQSQRVTGIVENLRACYEIHSAIRAGTVRKGQQWRDTTFDLTTGKNITITTQCVGLPDSASPFYDFVNHDDLIGRDEKWRVDTLGRTLLQEVAPLFVARRGGHAEPDTGAAQGITTFAELSELFRVPAERGPRAGEMIRVRLRDGARMHESVGRFYHAAGDGVCLKEPPSECVDDSGIRTSRSKHDWLASTVVVQADDPQIRALADSLVCSRTGRCEIIGALTGYVFSSIKKRNVATFSNATETLKSGFGDCGEHAVLLAALLRAAGIESNVVLGLVYVAAKGGYFYHAWVAAYAKNLLFADPAFGLFPASGGYVPLVIDDTGRNTIHLAGLIDRVEILYAPAR